MNRIAACVLSLLFAAPLHAMTAQGVELGGGSAGTSCGGSIDLVRNGGTTDFSFLLANANAAATRPAGAERRDPPRTAVQQAQWLRRTDSAGTEPGLGVLLVAGLLGMWAVARRRNLSS